MKWLVLLVALWCSAAVGQVREGRSAEAVQYWLMIISIYQKPEVEQACRNKPDGYVTVLDEGREIPIHCPTRRAALETYARAVSEAAKQVAQ